MQVKVKDLRVGDMVENEQGGTSRVTRIGYWSPTALFIEVDSNPASSGWMKRDDVVEVTCRQQ